MVTFEIEKPTYQIDESIKRRGVLRVTAPTVGEASDGMRALLALDRDENEATEAAPIERVI
jgi:hypothetical protein